MHQTRSCCKPKPKLKIKRKKKKREKQNLSSSAKRTASDNFLNIFYDPRKKMWTSVNYPYGDKVTGSIGQRFLATMRRTDPAKIIDFFYDTNRQRTVREVYEQSIIVATNLKDLGIEKGDVVVFFCANSDRLAILTMGCILVGAVVNFCDVYLPHAHLDVILLLLDPSMILFEEDFKDEFFQITQGISLSKCRYMMSIDGNTRLNATIHLLNYDYAINFDLFQSVEIDNPEEEVAFLVLTSGVTNRPKLVEITHTLILHSCQIWWNNRHNYEPLNCNSVVFTANPLRCISHYVLLLQSMLMGIKRVSFSYGRAPDSLLALLRTSEITHLISTPDLFRSILRQLRRRDVDSLKSLKIVQLSGEQVSTRYFNLAKTHCINARVFRCYIMTEMGGCIANDEIVNGGKLLPGYQLQIVDYLYNPLGYNEHGQILLKPPFTLRGYHNHEDESYYNHHYLLITGDYGYMDDFRNLHIIGRYSDLIYSDSFMITPDPVEQAVIALAEVSEAYLVGYRNPRYSLDQHAAFFIVLEDDYEASEYICRKISRIIKSRLRTAEYSILKHVYYVDDLPRTTCGKLHRALLKGTAYSNATA